MKYYIAKDGQPAGPYAMSDLINQGLTPDSQVWNDRMTGWTRAADVPELSGLLRQVVDNAANAVSPYAPGQTTPQASPETPDPQPTGYGQQPSPHAQPQYQQGTQPQYNQPYQPQYQQPYQQQPQYGQPYQQPLTAPKSWMTEAIIVTVISALACCAVPSLVCGIIAIINASKVNNLFYKGYYDLATQASKSAKVWTLVALGLIVAMIVVGIIFALTYPGLGMESLLDDYATEEVVIPESYDPI